MCYVLTIKYSSLQAKGDSQQSHVRKRDSNSAKTDKKDDRSKENHESSNESKEKEKKEDDKKEDASKAAGRHLQTILISSKFFTQLICTRLQ